MQNHKVKQLGKMSMYAKGIGECMQGDSAGSNPSLCLFFNRRNETFITYLCFFCLGHQGGRRCRITLECKEKVDSR